MSEKVSAGLLMYRVREGKYEVLLGHPGGPIWGKKDEGAWDILKGQVEEGESNLFEVAKREFNEETGKHAEGEFVFLGEVKSKSTGKTVHAWAFESDLDPSEFVSNTVQIEWPPKSGKKIEIPEIDKFEFFDLDTARIKIYPYLVPLLDEFQKKITS